MSKKPEMVEVEATGPIQHGDENGVRVYKTGERFSVSVDMAKQLVAANAVKQPGVPSVDEKAEKEAVKLAASIDEANAKAAAEAKAPKAKAKA